MAAVLSYIPIPGDDDDKDGGCVSDCDRRLWIGNLDHRITEYVLLKLVQRFGTPESYDFIYHHTGPDKGKPKGYCFVTYPTKENAVRAMRGLHNKVALSRRLLVQWANEKQQLDTQQPGGSSRRDNVPMGSVPRYAGGDSTERTIRAIEAKLSVMEDTRKDFGVSDLPAAPPGSNRYSQSRMVDRPAQLRREHHREAFRTDHRRRPYTRMRGRPHR